MRKVIINIGVLLLACLLVQAYAQAQPGKRLFEEAKVLIFDKEWKEAQEKLEELLDKHPDSPWSGIPRLFSTELNA
jgi:outer membrane protein assembly factor BamD (BamD/ComL family)